MSNARIRMSHCWMVAAALMTSDPTPAMTAEPRLLPPSARLVGPHARQRFVVRADRRSVGDGRPDAPGGVRDRQSPGRDRRSSDGLVRPVGDGLATITATVDGRVPRGLDLGRGSRPRRALELPEPRRADADEAGVQLGACHGAAAGKNGFRLTLRGYAPEVDHAVLTRQSLGRRIVKTAPAGEPDPAQADRRDRARRRRQVRGRLAGISGHRRMDRRRHARALGRRPGDPRARRMFPAAVRMEPGQAQQVLVQAIYSDGRVEDVTHWAKFGSTDDGGRLGGRRRPAQGHRPGRGVRLGLVRQPGRPRHGDVAVRDQARSRTSSPGARATNPIDEKNLAKLAALRIPPSPDAGDAAFLRRAYLDATGTLAAGRRRSRRSSRIAIRRSGPSWSTGCSKARNTSITGPTSGRTCCWSRRGSCRRRRCGRSTSSCARAWRRTCPGTGSPARS